MTFHIFVWNSKVKVSRISESEEMHSLMSLNHPQTDFLERLMTLHYFNSKYDLFLSTTTPMSNK